MLLLYFLSTYFKSNHELHFSFELNSEEKLIHYSELKSGFSDWTYVMVYSTNDEILINKIVENWQLKPSSTYEDNPISFMASFSERPVWWPTSNKLNNISTKYFRVNKASEQYWSLWVPENKGVIFVERGNW